MDSSWLHPREELVRTMQRIYRYRMTTTSGGNLSILDPDGGIWITPSRVDKGRLQPTDIVCMRPDGSCEGLHPPSSEFPFHRQIYQARPDIKAIVHAHPGALVVGRDGFDRLEVLEATAEALLMGRPLGPLVPMPEPALGELRRAFKME